MGKKKKQKQALKQKPADPPAEAPPQQPQPVAQPPQPGKPTIFSYTHSGPLPDPFSFQAYAKVLPDAPERIMRMAEKEQEHRHEMERKIVDADRIGYFLGQLIAGGLATFIIWVTYDLIRTGHSIQGLFVGGGGLATIALGFLRNRYTDRESLPAKVEKAEPNEKKRG